MNQRLVNVMDDLDEVAVETVKERVAAIRPHLAGLHHGIQGAVLADLLAGWLARLYRGGPHVIEGLLDMHIEKVNERVPANIKIIKSRGG